MAGYFKKLNGYVYEGEYPAGVALANGLFAEISNGEVILASAEKALRAKVTAVTDLFGVRAVEAVITVVGADEVYFVENEWDINDNQEYDESLYTCKVGDMVRMRRPTLGDKIVFTSLVGDVDDSVAPTATGVVVVK